MCFSISSTYKYFDKNIFFFRECRVATLQWQAQDDRIAKNLWDETCRFLHLKHDEDFDTFLKTISNC